MDEQRFNMSMRKFLKEVGVTSQQAIEQVVREEGLGGKGALKVKMVVSTLPNITDNTCSWDAADGSSTSLVVNMLRRRKRGRDTLQGIPSRFIAEMELHEVQEKVDPRSRDTVATQEVDPCGRVDEDVAHRRLFLRAFRRSTSIASSCSFGAVSTSMRSAAAWSIAAGAKARSPRSRWRCACAAWTAPNVWR